MVKKQQQLVCFTCCFPFLLSSFDGSVKMTFNNGSRLTASFVNLPIKTSKIKDPKGLVAEKWIFSSFRRNKIKNKTLHYYIIPPPKVKLASTSSPISSSPSNVPLDFIYSH